MAARKAVTTATEVLLPRYPGRTDPCQETYKIGSSEISQKCSSPAFDAGTTISTPQWERNLWELNTSLNMVLDQARPPAAHNPVGMQEEKLGRICLSHPQHTGQQSQERTNMRVAGSPQKKDRTDESQHGVQSRIVTFYYVL